MNWGEEGWGRRGGVGGGWEEEGVGGGGGEHGTRLEGQELRGHKRQTRHTLLNKTHILSVVEEIGQVFN